MRFFRLVAAAALGCALTIAGVRCAASSQEAADVLSATMADDANWYHILRQNIKLSSGSFGPRTAEMLDELKVKDDEPFATHLVVRRLVVDRGATGSQLAFGLRALGTAVSCQFVNTLLVHMFFVKVYANRDHVKVESVRWCMSKVQAVLAAYVDKVAAFDGQPLDYFVGLNDGLNALHARHEADEQLGKDEFLAELDRMLDDAKRLLADRCGATEEQEIIKTLRVNSYNDNIFDVTENVEDHQLLAMIQHLDPYEYVRVDSLGAAEWKKRLAVVEYKLPIDLSTVVNTGDDADE